MLVISILVATMCFGAERKYEKKLPAISGGKLTVNADGGSIRVVGTDSKEVSVIAMIRGRERNVNEYHIEAFEGQHGVEIKGRGDDQSWFRLWDNRDIDVQISVSVPKEYNAFLNTSGGDIDITGLTGSMRGETSGGNIVIEDVNGGIAMETSGGDVRAQRVNGDVRMETSGGNITIAEVEGNVEVNTSGGDVRIVDVHGKVRAESSGGNIFVSIRNENKGIYAETSGGDIDIMLDGNIGAVVEASTSGGEVSCDLPVTMKGKFDDQRLKGNINGGGNPVHAHTSGGDVRIRTYE